MKHPVVPQARCSCFHAMWWLCVDDPSSRCPCVRCPVHAIAPRQKSIMERGRREGRDDA